MADTRKPTPVNLGVKQTPRPTPTVQPVRLATPHYADRAAPRIQSVHMPQPVKSSASVPTIQPVKLGTAKK